jgi:flagellar protein FliO/FliZ
MRWLRLVAVLAVCAAATAASAAPESGKDGQGMPAEEPREFDFWSYALNMLVVLAIAIGLIFLLFWILRVITGRRLSLGSGGLIQVIASLPLGDRRFISVMRVGAHYYLIGISAGEITMLSELDREEVERHLNQEPKQGEGGFAAVLRRITGKRKEDSK